MLTFEGIILKKIKVSFIAHVCLGKYSLSLNIFLNILYIYNHNTWIMMWINNQTLLQNEFICTYVVMNIVFSDLLQASVVFHNLLGILNQTLCLIHKGWTVPIPLCILKDIMYKLIFLHHAAFGISVWLEYLTFIAWSEDSAIGQRHCG